MIITIISDLLVAKDTIWLERKDNINYIWRTLITVTLFFVIPHLNDCRTQPYEVSILLSRLITIRNGINIFIVFFPMTMCAFLVISFSIWQIHLLLGSKSAFREFSSHEDVCCYNFMCCLFIFLLVILNCVFKRKIYTPHNFQKQSLVLLLASSRKFYF